MDPRRLVFLDNAGAHKPPSVHKRIRDAGAHVMFLPPCSPDLSSIEPCWAKLEQLLKKSEALTVATLDAAIARAVELITPDDARGWFTHWGHRAQPE